MDSFTIELVSNASLQLKSNNTLSYCTNLIPEQVNLEEEWEVAISDTSYPSMYQIVTEGKFMFLVEKLFKTTEPYYPEPGLYSSIIDIVESMNTLIEERNNHSDTCIRIKVNSVTQKIEIYLANEESSLAFCSANLGH